MGESDPDRGVEVGVGPESVDGSAANEQAANESAANESAANAGPDTDAESRDDESDSGGSVAAERQELRPLDLDEALSILGEETRARILVELGDAWTADPPGPAYLSYSELMERVGAEDSGRFNYHLDKLVGTFVDRSEEGYAVRQPGKTFHEAVVAGSFTDRDRIEGGPVGDCPACEGELVATYRTDQILVVDCSTCDRPSAALHVPPRAFDGRATDEVLDVAGQLVFHELAQFRRGVCPTCGGTVERSLVASLPDEWPDEFDLDVFATVACSECKESNAAHPAGIAVTTPAVVGFCNDHDRDAALLKSWGDVFREARAETVVVDDDPMRVAVPFALDDERLRVVLDDDLAVVDTERSPR